MGCGASAKKYEQLDDKPFRLPKSGHDHHYEVKMVIPEDEKAPPRCFEGGMKVTIRCLGEGISEEEFLAQVPEERMSEAKEFLKHNGKNGTVDRIDHEKGGLWIVDIDGAKEHFDKSNLEPVQTEKEAAEEAARKARNEKAKDALFMFHPNGPLGRCRNPHWFFINGLAWKFRAHSMTITGKSPSQDPNAESIGKLDVKAFECTTQGKAFEAKREVHYEAWPGLMCNITGTYSGEGGKVSKSEITVKMDYWQAAKAVTYSEANRSFEEKEGLCLTSQVNLNQFSPADFTMMVSAKSRDPFVSIVVGWILMQYMDPKLAEQRAVATAEDLAWEEAGKRLKVTQEKIDSVEDYDNRTLGEAMKDAVKEARGK